MDFGNEITKLCYKHFKSLPKKGKPQAKKEWTLLAAIVMSSVRDKADGDLKIVSMSTGTKCLGYSQLNDKGDVISDSHAEVLARRGLIKFILHHMHLLLNNQNSEVLTFDETSCKFSLKLGIKFHLFISHVPCGDAAIFPKHVEVNEDIGGETKPKKIKLDSDTDDNDVGEISTCNDLYRTGAKCVDAENPDPRGRGMCFHVTGVLRTKPGRGDPTWSMSCSDKIALWNVCGLQGALLAILLSHPIYLTSLVLGKCPFSLPSMQRAIINRLSQVQNLPSGYSLSQPSIYHSSLEFEFSKQTILKENAKVVPSPAAIIWCNVSGDVEVSVNGKKQGVTKKDADKPSSRISICRSILFQKFLEVCELLPNETIKAIFQKDLTLLECKKLDKPYQDAKAVVFKIFDKWKQKPIQFQNFTVCKK